MALLGSDLTPQRTPARLWLVPVLATLLASMLGWLPVVATAPALPSFGLLTALAWRLLRPEMWPPWVALLLGLADDLVSGAPLGTAACLWTICFLVLDYADHRPTWRDHWMDWWLASLAILFCGLGDWAITAFVAGAGRIWTWVPTALLGIFFYPGVAWACTRLDRWRLRK